MSQILESTSCPSVIDLKVVLLKMGLSLSKSGGEGYHDESILSETTEETKQCIGLRLLYDDRNSRVE